MQLSPARSRPLPPVSPQLVQERTLIKVPALPAALDLELNLIAESGYKSASQLARLSTERWTLDNFYCPSCGDDLSPYRANTPLYDFHSVECHERFQLKASRREFGKSVLDSEYHTALRGVIQDAYPSLILLHYDPVKWVVSDLDLVHRACITPSCLLPRRPLGDDARRAGWQGCLISLVEVPALARINVIREGVVRPQSEVLLQWKQSDRLLEAAPQARGWLADVLRCVERLYSTFTLENVYSFEAELAAKHPKNRNIRPKIRQQLQALRDLGIIEFVSPGVYKNLRT